MATTSETVLFSSLAQNVLVPGANGLWFDPPKDNPGGNGGRTSYAHRSQASRGFVYVQWNTSKAAEDQRIRTPFGISVPLDISKEHHQRKTVELGFRHAGAEEALLALEDYAIQFVATHSKDWFKKPMTVDQVKNKWTSVLRYPNDDKYDPHFRTKMNTEGPFVVKAYALKDDGRSIVPVGWKAVNRRKAGVLPTTRIAGLWMASGKIGLTLELSDVILFDHFKPDEADVPRVMADEGLEGGFVVVEPDATPLAASSNDDAKSNDAVGAHASLPDDMTFRIAPDLDAADKQAIADAQADADVPPPHASPKKRGRKRGASTTAASGSRASNKRVAVAVQD